MKRRDWSLLLLLVPFIALLYPPFYNTLRPQFLGLSFFVWYQMVWSVLAAAFTYAVYLIRRAEA